MKKKIFNICNQLAEQGIKPTLVRVRSELGGGSFSTINPFLKQWKETRTVCNTQEINDLRTEIVAISQKATLLMWKAANDHCNKVKKGQQNELIALRIKADKAEATVRLLRMELEEVHRQKAVLERMLLVCQAMGNQVTSKLTTKNTKNYKN
jgi:hypothetical protein